MSANLSHELHEIGSNSVPYLLMLLLNKVEAVSYKPNYKGSNVSHEIDMELFISFFKRCFGTCEKRYKNTKF
ncbi:conserved protein of unknown function (plasmid) [Vibrio tapetis subsp. tapetis]|uniref:Uncharacterized protein n=2 Tax=Vibrio tapetis TaxID=52443 RepID=A0A2N8ZHS9_9VIBR|nr:hypothetical protein pVT1_58 [Vibrio tapetis]SON51448.1 conserved protein of unknown function [Vibrio tapetis subsp. tapetis]SON53506.1 conserved protein of unknown function [Vibrio tapetis subsp. tapetis]